MKSINLWSIDLNLLVAFEAMMDQRGVASHSVGSRWRARTAHRAWTSVPKRRMNWRSIWSFQRHTQTPAKPSPPREATA